MNTKPMLIAGIAACLLSSCTNYTHDRPDTAVNRKGFARHIGFTVPTAVSNLYFYADEMGADCAYQLGFSADRTTVQRIVTQLGLQKSQPPFSDGISRDFPWWKKAELQSLTPYWKQNDKKDYLWFLWYDDTKQQAWFLEYSL